MQDTVQSQLRDSMKQKDETIAKLTNEKENLEKELAQFKKKNQVQHTV